VWTLAGDDAKALDRLKAYLAVNPGRRAEFRDHPSWWFRRLSEDPRSRQLVGVPR
jgi:hypothetical protein